MSRRRVFVVLSLAVIPVRLPQFAAAQASLQPVAKLEMPASVQGKFDHLGIDEKGSRCLFRRERTSGFGVRPEERGPLLTCGQGAVGAERQERSAQHAACGRFEVIVPPQASTPGARFTCSRCKVNRNPQPSTQSWRQIAKARIIRGRPVSECALWPAQVAGALPPHPQDLALGASPDAGLAARWVLKG